MSEQQNNSAATRPEAVIAARNLTKRYGKSSVVDTINFDIAKGEVFGLLGPNGAGKTTTILMMLGLTEISAGRVSVLGFDPARQPLQVKRRVGYLPDAVGFYDNLTAVENLAYAAKLMGLSMAERARRIAAALTRVRLSDVADKRVATFSRGMRQRLGLAEIIVKRAEIAILDEPTSGLDPQATLEFLDLIRELKAEGVTVLLSSHMLDQVQRVCDRVALFRAGRIAMMGSVAELAVQVLGAGFVVEVEADGAGIARRLAAIPGVGNVETLADDRFRMTADRDVRADAARAVVAANGALRRLSVDEPSLEAIYARYFQAPPQEACAMRREGSAFQGVGAVFVKELSDNISSVRMLMLELLIVLTAMAALYEAITTLRQNTAEDPFLLLRLFTVDQAPLPSFVAILGFLIPLMAIGLGFDLINSEHNRRTLSRILAQPIYRDALLLGKYLAGLATIAISLTALWLLVIGLGLIFLGVPPGGEEIARSLAFLVIAIFYAGVWLSLAMLLSIVFRSPATAALVALGIWLFLTVLWPMLAPAIAQAIVPPDPRFAALGLDTPGTAIWSQLLQRFSPNDLFGEAMLAVLSPTTRTLGPVFLDQIRGAVMGAPLPFGASVLIAWPQTVGLIACSIVLFVAGYVLFQRQEVRA